MKRNTKFALVIAISSILFISIMLGYAEKQFQESGQSIRLGVEFKSEEAKAKDSVIQALIATNEDLIRASVFHHTNAKKADSALSIQERIIKQLEFSKKNSNETIDSLIAIIEQYRKSDI